MPAVETADATLHVEIDGEGPPVTVVAHGLTNNCRELAALTPLIPGTTVRFDFRGHGRSTAPEMGYRFEDLARDLDAVARAYGATRAVGTSLGAGAIANLVAREPGRFERMVWLLPAALDMPFGFKDRYLELAAQLDGKTPEEALEAIVSDPARVAQYVQTPWKLEIDKVMWDHRHPEGVARAIREVIEDWPVSDRDLLRWVTAPTLLICIEGDDIHPAELGRILDDLLPHSELLMFESEAALFQAIPSLVQRVGAFLAGND
ncbi:MAG TPA: alpha/beta hydrolase [Actinomycetota bacterium]|nr:alpha/beta hydrolase [Actinomycetota bacterium]